MLFDDTFNVVPLVLIKRRLFNDMSPFIKSLLFNDTSPLKIKFPFVIIFPFVKIFEPTIKLPFIEVSKFTNSLLFNEASPPINVFPFNEVSDNPINLLPTIIFPFKDRSPFMNTLLFNETSPPINVFPFNDKSVRTFKYFSLVLPVASMSALNCACSSTCKLPCSNVVVIAPVLVNGNTVNPCCTITLPYAVTFPCFP